MMEGQIPETLERPDFYRRVMRTLVERFPGYEMETGEVFLGLMSAHETITTHFGKRLSRHGLTLAGFNLLMILNSSTYRETGCAMSQLGELLLVSKANITGLIDNLERKQLVKRVDAAYDRRVKLAQLTAKGAKLMVRIIPGHFQEVNRVAGVLSTQDRRKLAAMLRKLNQEMAAALKAGLALEEGDEEASK